MSTSTLFDVLVRTNAYKKLNFLNTYFKIKDDSHRLLF
jgi:hypothetical protein